MSRPFDFAHVRELLQHPPSATRWRALCALLESVDGEEVELVCDYVAGHLADWDDALRTPPYAWWRQAQRSVPPAFWPLVSGYLTQAPHDEIITAYRCDCVSLTRRMTHLEAACLFFHRDGITLHDTDHQQPPLFLDREELRDISIEPIVWDPQSGEENSLRLTFADGESLELRFDSGFSLTRARYDLRCLLAGSFCVLELLPERESAEEPHYEAIRNKWNVSFQLTEQESSRLFAQQAGRYLRTWREVTSDFPLGLLREIVQVSWKRLSSPSRRCLTAICDVFESRWGWDTEDTEGTYCFVPLASMYRALQEMSLVEPPEEAFEEYRLMQLYKMLDGHLDFATLVKVTLRWGY